MPMQPLHSRQPTHSPKALGHTPALVSNHVVRVTATQTIAPSELSIDHLTQTFSLTALRTVTSRLKAEGNLKDMANTGFYRPRDTKGNVGAVCVLADYLSERDTMVLGDQHGNKTMLDHLFEHYRYELVDSKINIVLLGDIKDPEIGYLRDFDSSYDLFKSIVMAKFHLPDNFHMIQGNHDPIFPGVKDPAKAEKIVEWFLSLGQNQKIEEHHFTTISQLGLGNELSFGKRDMVTGEVVWQGAEYTKYLIFRLKAEGKTNAQIAEELMAYQEFIDNCPLAVVSKGEEAITYMSHAGIVEGGFPDMKSLINAQSDKRLKAEMLCNRYNPAKASKSGNYDEDAIFETIRSLYWIFGVKIHNVHVLVGHSPGEEWIYSPSNRYRNNFQIVHSNIVYTHNGGPSYGYPIISNGIPRPINLNIPTRAA